jgi:hypothetical protein
MKFDTLAFFGAVTGRLLRHGGFSAVHEALEAIVGRPVQTHPNDFGPALHQARGGFIDHPKFGSWVRMAEAAEGTAEALEVASLIEHKFGPTVEAEVPVPREDIPQ